MTCGGCSGAIERILGKVEGITAIQCDIEAQQVLVTGVDGLDPAKLLEKWVSFLHFFSQKVR